MTYGFRPARRSEAKPLIGLYSKSGCGKTLSALMIARGFVGPGGNIGMIETEAGRGEAYDGDPRVGHYIVRPIRDDFNPIEYGKALTEAEQAKLGALIIDSASHEWEGAGGVLAMAAQRLANGAKSMLAWQQPKMDHQRHFMLRLMQTPIPLVIVCMRAKYPMMEKPKPGGGKEWVRSEDLEPTQSEDILFELFIHGWIDTEHRFHGTKYTIDELRQVIVDNQPISLDTGRRLAAWARGNATIESVGGSPEPKTDAGPARAEQSEGQKANGPASDGEHGSGDIQSTGRSSSITASSEAMTDGATTEQFGDLNILADDMKAELRRITTKKAFENYWRVVAKKDRDILQTRAPVIYTDVIKVMKECGGKLSEGVPA